MHGSDTVIRKHQQQLPPAMSQIRCFSLQVVRYGYQRPKIKCIRRNKNEIYYIFYSSLTRKSKKNKQQTARF